MKAISYILCFYVVLLSVLPCSDRVECSAFQKNEVATTTDHGNHQDEQEQCSPFCICSCCGVSMNTPMASAQVSIIREVPIELSSFIPAFNLDEPSYSIWQPPKIG